MTRTRLAAGTAVCAAALTGGALALAAGGTDTTVVVSPHTTLAAPTVSPIDAPGAPAVRKGKAIPTGYAIVLRPVAITAGSENSGAVIRLACPAGMKTRTLAGAVNLIGSYHTTYVVASVWQPPGVKAGATAKLTAYLVCKK